MSFESVKTKIQSSLQSGETLSPFLFLWSNLELLHSQLQDFTYELLEQHNIPKTSIISLPDDGENLKIQSIRTLLQSSSVKSTYSFQIFIIENISRLTLASSNSMLKFLEEPGEGNIIFLTNTSESGVLDTILSRVVSISPSPSRRGLGWGQNAFFVDLLKNIDTKQGKQNILSYIYGLKWEKSEYIDFLQTLLKAHILSAEDMQKLHDDIAGIENNNVLPKYILDKWIMRII